MELLQQVTNTQFLAAGVAVISVLILVVLVFIFSFKSVKEPVFAKSPLVVADRKVKKPKPPRKDTQISKKSPAKEKLKEQEQTEKNVKIKEAKLEKEKAKKEAQAQAKNEKLKKKVKVTNEKTADIDEGNWEKVPTKTIKKKTTKPQEENNKQDSPVKEKNRFIQIQKEDGESSAEELFVEKTDFLKEKVVKVEKSAKDKPVKLVENVADAEIERKLLEQINEVQRVLREAELRSMSPYERKVEEQTFSEVEKKIQENNHVEEVEEEPAEVLKPVKIEKPAKVGKTAAVTKPKEEKPAENGNEPAVAFDELGDAWTESKTTRKNKKKVRKDQ